MSANLDPHVMEERNERVTKLRADGLTLHQIGALEGVGGARIRDILLQRQTRAERAEALRKELESPALSRRVDYLDLSIRSRNCLKNDYIDTLGDLIQKNEAELLRVPNFGRHLAA